MATWLRDRWDQMFGPKADKGIFVGVAWSRYGGKRESPSYAAMGDRYLAHPQVRYPVDSYAAVIVGGGFSFVGKTEEESDLADEDPEVNEDRVREAIKFLDDWVDDWPFMKWLYDSVKDLRGFGNLLSVWRRKEGKHVGLARLPFYTVDKFQITERGQIVLLRQNIKGATKIWEGNELKSLIHLTWNPFDTGVIGRGVFDSVVRKGPGYSYYTADNTLQTEYRPSHIEIIEENEDMMRKSIHRTTPRHLYALKGLPQDQQQTFTGEIKKLRPEDDIIMSIPPDTANQKRDVVVHRIAHESRSNIDPLISYFFDTTLMGLQSPSTKMIFSPKDYSEALSRTVERVELREMGLFQTLLGDDLMRFIFSVVLEENGFEDCIKLIKIRWGPVSRLEMTIPDLISLGQGNFIGRNEVREFLSREVGFPLSAEPEYMGIQGGATLTEEGDEVVGAGAQGSRGQYDKGAKPDTGEEEEKEES